MDNGLQIVGLLAVGAYLATHAPARKPVTPGLVVWVVVVVVAALRLWQVWG